MDLHLQDKYALITGASRGTGEVIAKQLKAEGANVIRHSMNEQGYQYLQKNYPGEIAIWGDLASIQGCEQSLTQLWQAVSQVDILINNFGTATPGKWQDYKENDWLDIYQTNVLSSARIISALLENMKQRPWGRIIQLSTIGSISPNARMPHYYASKAAMANMTVSLAKELAGTGITVNTVSPGLILTDEVKAAYTLKAQRKSWGSTWPDIEKAIVEHDFPNLSGRIATREEVADLVCFLASDRAGFINAQNLRVDGGSLALAI